VEVWDWSKAHSYLDREESVIHNLQEYKRKFLVTSFISEDTKRRLRDHDIIIIELGFQILPREWKAWYVKRGLTENKLFVNDCPCKRVIDLLRDKLKPILLSIEDLYHEISSSFNKGVKEVMYFFKLRIPKKISYKLKNELRKGLDYLLEFQNKLESGGNSALKQLIRVLLRDLSSVLNLGPMYFITKNIKNINLIKLKGGQERSLNYDYEIRLKTGLSKSLKQLIRVLLESLSTVLHLASSFLSKRTCEGDTICLNK